MRSPGRRAWRVAVLVLVVGYALCMGLLALYLQSAGDVTPWGMLLLFGPRWVLLLPWLVLVPAAWLVSRPLAAGAVLAVALTAFGVAGVEVPSFRGPRPARRALRLVTYNTDGSPFVAEAVRGAMHEWRADLVVFQVCSPPLADSLRAIVGDSLRVVSEFCVVSALPIRAIDTLPRASPDTPRTSAIRIDVETSDGPLTVFGVHFESPRTALWSARQLDFALLSESIGRRTVDSRRVAQWVRGAKTPFIVAGDFNLPQGSIILRHDWGTLENAFSERGWGFGYTMFAGKFAVRIDHVFVSPVLMTERIVLARGYPSEHQPVLVDVAWPAR